MRHIPNNKFTSMFLELARSCDVLLDIAGNFILARDKGIVAKDLSIFSGDCSKFLYFTQ